MNRQTPSQRISQALAAYRARAIPDDLDLWPAIQAQLRTREAATARQGQRTRVAAVSRAPARRRPWTLGRALPLVVSLVLLLLVGIIWLLGAQRTPLTGNPAGGPAPVRPAVDATPTPLLPIAVRTDTGPLPDSVATAAAVRLAHASPTPILTPMSALWPALAAHPLQLPTVTGTACPVTPAFDMHSSFPGAQGTGPVYRQGQQPGIAPGWLYYSGSFLGLSPWGSGQEQWIVDAHYRGPILVRGHQLDGPNELRFGSDASSAVALQLDGSTQILLNDWWLEWSVSTFVRAPGCYAYQVDGLTFSQMIVFRATDRPPGD